MKLMNVSNNKSDHSSSDSGIKLGRMAAVSLMLSILLSGCGGGGSSSQATTPPTPAPITFQLIFPGETSLTDSNQISVVGLADASRLTSVSIKNGNDEISASQDSAGRWRASGIPLSLGDNQLTVKLTENNGQVTELPISTVHSSPVLSNPTAVLFDALNERVLILDPKQLLSFDLTNNDLEILSATDVGIGPNFGFARHFTLDTDGAILVANLRDIQRVDPTTGDRSEYIILPVDAGPISMIAVDQQLGRLFAVGFFGDLYTADLSLALPISATTIRPLPSFGLFGSGPTDGAFDSTTDAIYAVSVSTIDITKIDASSGDSTSILLDFGNLVTPTVGIDYDNVDSRVLVLGNSGAVFSLDPTTQSSSLLLSPPSTPNRPVSLRGLSIGSDKLWTVTPIPGELRSIDRTTGAQTIEASLRVGDGIPPGPMLALRYDTALDRVVAIVDSRVIAIDPETGSRELLADLIDPTQPPLQSNLVLANGLALSQDGTRAWLSDMFNQKIIEVDLNNGEVTTVSGPTVGAGPLPNLISGIAINTENSVAYIADRFAQRILRVDLVSGQRSELTSLPAELAQSEIRSLVLDTAANRVLLNIAPFSPASIVEPSIYALDLVSLEFTLVATLSAIELPRGETTAPGTSIIQMSLSADGGILYTPVSGNADIPFAQVDLGVGIAEPLGTAASGVPFLAPNAIEVTPNDRIFALDSSGALLIVDPETGERSIISK
jgi:hypothetical protein